MKLIFRITVVLLLVSLLVSVLMRNKQEILYKSESAKEVIKDIPVEVTAVKMAKPALIIRSAGLVESSEEVIVIATVQGNVTSVNAIVGTSVKQGEIIAAVDDFYALKEYNIANEAYQQIAKDYERSRQLAAESAVTGQQLEQLKIQLDGAEAKKLSLQRRLDDMRIKAPVSGIINQVFVKKGGVLGNGSPVCEIVNPSGLKVTAHISETDLEHVEKGQQVIVSDNTGAGNSRSGVIAGTGVKPDRTGLYPVSIALDAKESGIKPGMLINVEIKTLSEPAIMIPWRIIRTVSGEKGVFVALNSQAVFKQIVTGNTYNDSIVVISGIEAGQQLVSNGYQFLNNGDRLKIVKEHL